eukprot:996370-Amphidinium_carterae.1
MFCVSNEQGKRFAMLLVCGGCVFLLSAALQLTRKTLPIYGKFARARSAWYETCQQHNRLLLASCVLLPSYGNMLLLACVVVADHLRFHVVGTRVPLQVFSVTLLHLCSLQSAGRFRDRHVAKNPLQVTYLRRKRGLGWGHHGDTRVYSLWIVLCVVALVEAEDTSRTECFARERIQ